MKLSTRTRYGTRALVELAAAYPDRPVSVREIAERQSISPKYLEHIINILRIGKIIRPTRGMHGGYQLAQPPAAIRLKEIYDLLEGTTAPVPCVDDPGVCPIRSNCPTRATWAALKQAIDGVLTGTTVADLLKPPERDGTADGNGKRPDGRRAAP